MAVYLGSQQVGFNTIHNNFAYWVGFSRSLSTKSSSATAARTAVAQVSAPIGVSIYAYKTIGGTSTSTYSAVTSVRDSRYYRARGDVYAALLNINSAPLQYAYAYLDSVSQTAYIGNTSAIIVVGAATIAFGITDTIISNSTLIYSRSTATSSFFTGIITPFKSISASLLTSISSNAFSHNHKLISANFSNCTTIASRAFYNCDRLTSISFPNCTTIGQNAFYSCSYLNTVDFPNCTTIGQSAFYGCISLASVTIGTSDCILGVSVFSETPIVNSSYLGYFGSIYVPLDYVNTYKTAKNWSEYADRITGF